MVSDMPARRRLADHPCDFGGLDAPHALASDRAIAQVAGVAWDRSPYHPFGIAPWRRTFGRGRSPQRNDRASDRRRNMHRARIRAEGGVAFGEQADQIAQASAAGQVGCRDAAEMAQDRVRQGALARSCDQDWMEARTGGGPRQGGYDLCGRLRKIDAAWPRRTEDYAQARPRRGSDETANARLLAWVECEAEGDWRRRDSKRVGEGLVLQKLQ